MSIKDGKDYLYLIWKSDKSRKQYVVGILSKNGNFEFKYCSEVHNAIVDGFTPLVSFPDIDVVYKNDVLFPVFASRLPDRKRKDIDTILTKYALKEFDAYELLKRSGARLPIDNLEFIDPILNFNKPFCRTFYMAGVRHYIGCDGDDCMKAIEVVRGDEVRLECEPENIKDKNAVAVYDMKNQKLGYIPRYYSEGISQLLKEVRDVHCFIRNADKSKSCHECIRLDLKVK